MNEEDQIFEQVRRTSYGQEKVTWVDRFGVYLSRRRIATYLKGRSNLIMADLGSGYYAKLLMSFETQLKLGVAVDLSLTPSLKQSPVVRAIESSIENALPQLEDNFFDVVLLNSVLEHLWNPQAILQECWRILSPSGQLIVNVPTWRGKFYLEYSAFGLGLSPKTEMDDHKMYYNKQDLWPLLVAAGFKPSQIDLKYYKFGLNLFASAKKRNQTHAVC